MKITILSSSLNKNSRSLILSEYAQQIISSKDMACNLIDLKKYDFPFCGEEGAYEHKNVKYIKNELASSDAIIVSGPVYNYGVNALTKNILDLTGEAWSDKPIGFLCTAGGQASYMSIMGFANSLMLNFRCLIVPRFVYAVSNTIDVEKREINDKEIIDRINQLITQIEKIARVNKE